MVIRRSSTVKKHILHIFAITSFILICVLSIYMYTTIKTSEEQFAQASQASLQLFASDLQMQANTIEAYMVDLALHNDAFRRLGAKTTPLQSYQDAYEIWLNLPSILNSNDILTGIILYSSVNQQEFSKYSQFSDVSLDQRARIRDHLQAEIIQLLQTGPVNTENWFFWEIGNQTYWLRIVRYLDVSIVAAVELNHLQNRALQSFAVSGNIRFLNNAGQVLLSTEDISGSLIRWTELGYGKYYSGHHISLVFSESCNTLELQYIQPYRTGLTIGSTLEIILLLCVVLSILAMLFLWLYVRRTLLRPLDALVNTMKKIGQGEFNARPSTDYQSLEFQQVNDTFNTMIDQITNLKIDSYEKQLAIQKSEMTALKLQIRPHFFLNCLKKLYAFAQIGHIDELQKMILLLSTHLRYVFSYQTETVPLYQELNLCKNYLELCNLGQAKPIQWHSDIPCPLQDLQVPTMSVLTFIENCVQYAIKGNEVLKVTVTVTRLELGSSSMVNLTISDNGPGFTSEQLDELNCLDGTQLPQQHIGIINNLRRFRLLYGEHFTVAFTNKRDGGAQIDVFLPLNEPERSHTKNEASDRG